MLLWLKKNYQSSINPKIKVPSFIGSFFNWRPKSVTIPDESKYQKYIDSIKVSDLNREMINNIIMSMVKFLLSDLMSEYLKNSKPEIPERSYSPRDLWSNQWHQIYNQIFQELGYLPVRNCFKHNKTLGRALGICAAFLISGVFHDYITIVTFNYFSIDYTIFFLFHGILLVLWEAVEGDILGRGKDFKDSFGIKIFKMSLFLPIVVFTLPSFVEPFIRRIHLKSHLNIYTNLTKWSNGTIYNLD
ncbi:31585_t:CDS:2 [Racocetra persica]|uniref:31585_t:CDS:1 n=1 Tax=Racocetra persica TaxID=160502 RepID=A0ACA9MW51_9GLOM|nr:31585_t:CDS:2 [Racocetra persica]